MRKMTDHEIQKEFLLLNERFFDDKLPWVEVRFGGNLPRTDGHFNAVKNQIRIDRKLRNFHSLSTIVLLHEMAHVSMMIQGYRGYPEEGGHGSLFQVELDRLYKAGAYDGLL